jgi:glycosyltransferase involved in cell wall biosynthesis
MRTVLQSSPNTCFLIAGDGSYTGFLRSYIRANRLDAGMRMLGAVSNSRIRELLALSDVLLLPSRMEGLSLAIYEAMAMGVVPISAAVGGQAELVTPDCGVLVLPGPTERQVYTEALLSLARDRERLAVMGQAARMRVRDHYRLDQMGQRMHNLLQEAHALHRAQPRTVPTLEQAAAAQAQVVQALGQVDDTAPTPARRARKVARHLYTMLIERGGWWLVPLVEKLRER